MVSPVSNGGARVSTVVPGRLRGETAEDRTLSGVDLAFKLHYVRGLYVFRSPPPLTMRKIKDPMFVLLDRFVAAAGRVRRSGDGEDGIPYIKCNDAGVRIVEAFSDDTVEELLEKLKGNDDDGTYYDDVAIVVGEDGGSRAGLCYDAVLGPDLAFSPLVFIQFTWLKCGGLSIGLSWAHILGGVSTASAFINTWAKIMAGHVAQDSMHVTCPEKAQDSHPPRSVVPEKKALSLKELESVGNYWLLNPKTQPNMTTHSFVVTLKQLEALRVHASCDKVKKARKFSEFEILSAAIWKSLSQIRVNNVPKISTVCRYDYSPIEMLDEILRNESLIISTAEADPRDHDISELAFKIANVGAIENNAIDDFVVKSNGKVDFFVYGANLTFVDLGDINVHGLELLGEKPAFANYTIEGVGNEGVVLVLPCSADTADGRMVTLIFSRDELASLKTYLREQWGIA